ncbi:AAA family ATPase [Roseateles chitosanitabidus]|uniref:AAA family ATPase n=1 Tax=Roseateles chitosanitabidus TaxID=65048 RepID=UPI00082B9EBE|nr:AAA family ATPase [Roseateles chitosanitabidus]
MKLNRIEIRNVLGIAFAEIDLPTPVAFFAGFNGSGKTSIVEAVRMALGGDLVARGVKLKKELKSLVHEGAKDGSAEVIHGDGTPTFALFPSGKTTDENVYRPSPFLHLVCEPHAFAAMNELERRKTLFALMKVKLDVKDVIARLKKRGVDEKKVDRVGPLLKAGFEAAHDASKLKGTEAKSAWRVTTGEVYGSEKAKDWAAEVPAFDAGAAAPLRAELAKLDADLEAGQQNLGAMQAEEKRRQEQRAKLPALEAKVDTYQRVDNKLAVDRAGLAEWEQKLAATKAEAGQGKRVGLVHDLAAAVAYLLPFGQTSVDKQPTQEECDAEAALTAYEREHGRIGATGSPEAAARIPEYQKARDLMANAVAAGETALAEIQAAQAEHEIILQAMADDAGGDPAVRAEAEGKVAKMKARRAEIVVALDRQHTLQLAADSAAKKTADAAEHHADVVAWDLITTALAPDGIPGELLAEALDPFNARLQQSADDAEWPVLKLGTDMVLRQANGRAYQFFSEAEKWRADAMLAEAISHLSGLRFLMLDRFDVLDNKGRADALAWVDVLAREGEIDTVLMFGTLKSVPALPQTFTAHWVQRGEIAELAEAA